MIASSEKAATTGAPIGRPERWLLAGLFFVLLVLRILYACWMNFNSDEGQHLHVVWGWTRGLLQYRDVFDNHTPLFHILCAPLFALFVRIFGETPMIMIYMRLALVPVFAAGISCVVWIGERLFSRRVGLWAALLTGFAPFYFLKTVEFRTDDLWTVMWLAVMAITVGGPLSRQRIFAVGLMMGATFAVSMKTVLLLLGLLLAAAVTIWQRRKADHRTPGRDLAFGFAAGLLGILVVPGSIVGYFAAQHALKPLHYCVIQHNLLPSSHQGFRFSFRQIWFPLAAPLLVLAAREIFRRTPDAILAARRTLVLLAGVFYLALLISYWPMLTGQDYPPIIPLGVLWLTPAILALGEHWSLGIGHWSFPKWSFPTLPLALALLEIGVVFRLIHPRARVASHLDMLGKVLRCTDPSDYVMDAKSGAIFRRRPFYFALENVTLARMRMGLIPDEIIPELIAKRTCMVSEKRLDGRDFDFIRTHYVPFSDSMRVAGQPLPMDEIYGKSEFEIRISTEYVILSPNGQASGALDGKPYSGKVLLDISPHEFISEHPRQPHVLYWAKAWERGFTPNFSPEPIETPSIKKR